MPLVSLSDTDFNTISITVYGPVGGGKTMLAMSMYPDDPHAVRYITGEVNGLKTLRAMGFPPDMKYVLIDKNTDPLDQVASAMEQAVRDPKVKLICVDGITHMSGMFIDVITGGMGEKQMGFDGWGEMLTKFRIIEELGQAARRKSKSVVYTAWELPPEYENTMGGPALKLAGGPYIMGKSKIWIPGTCDIVCRQTGAMKTILGPDKKPVRKFVSELHLKQQEEWVTRTKFAFLPEKVPADLKALSELIAKGARALPKAPVAPPLKRILPVVKK